MARAKAKAKGEGKGRSKKRLTITEIAALAGVSTATVSRVLNGKKDVSPRTRRRIQQLIEAYNYRPHALARGLSLKRTQNLGLIIPHTADYLFSSPYFAELIRGISQQANAQGYRLLLSTTTSEQPSQAVYDEMLQGVVDGLIVLDVKVRDSRLLWLKQEGIPFVLVGQPLDPAFDWGTHISYVDSDNKGGAYQATRYLLELDHKEVFLLNGPKDHAVSITREQGFQQALDEAGLSQRAQVIYGEFSLESGRTFIEELLRQRRQRRNLDFGLLAASDVQALGAIAALKEAEVAVGRNVSVIGFDDVPLARAFDPPLTTVRQPIFTIGQEAVRLLIRCLEEPEAPPLQTIFPTELIVRQSTRPLKR